MALECRVRRSRLDDVNRYYIKYTTNAGPVAEFQPFSLYKHCTVVASRLKRRLRKTNRIENKACFTCFRIFESAIVFPFRITVYSIKSPNIRNEIRASPWWIMFLFLCTLLLLFCLGPFHLRPYPCGNISLRMRK